MVSSLLVKKALLVKEVAAKLSEHLDPAFHESLRRCLSRLDILSLRTLGSLGYTIRRVPQEVALVSEACRPFGWAVWLAIVSDANLDDPEWILGGVLKGSGGWGFSRPEAQSWRREYVRAHFTAPAPAAARRDPTHLGDVAVIACAPQPHS
jgi:hypothetical protein